MSATNVARAGKRGKICLGNNVSLFARAFNSASSAVISSLSKSRRCRGTISKIMAVQYVLNIGIFFICHLENNNVK